MEQTLHCQEILNLHVRKKNIILMSLVFSEFRDKYDDQAL